jgi:hypothetical protein
VRNIRGAHRGYGARASRAAAPDAPATGAVRGYEASAETFPRQRLWIRRTKPCRELTMSATEDHRHVSRQEHRIEMEPQSMA